MTEYFSFNLVKANPITFHFTSSARIRTIALPKRPLAPVTRTQLDMVYFLKVNLFQGHR